MCSFYLQVLHGLMVSQDFVLHTHTQKRPTNLSRPPRSCFALLSKHNGLENFSGLESPFPLFFFFSFWRGLEPGRKEGCTFPNTHGAIWQCRHSQCTAWKQQQGEPQLQRAQISGFKGHLGCVMAFLQGDEDVP